MLVVRAQSGEYLILCWLRGRVSGVLFLALIMSISVHFCPLKQTGFSRECEFYRKLLDDESDAGLVCVEDADTADWVIFTDLYHGYDTGDLREHPLYQTHPERCVLLSECDEPLDFWPGMYSSSVDAEAADRGVLGWHYPVFSEWCPNSALDAVEGAAHGDKLYLASFVGSPTHLLRERLARVKYSERMYVELVTGYNHFDDKGRGDRAQSFFSDVLLASQFCLCPRGRGGSSMRIYDAMRMGVAPVILSNDWNPPLGPDWESFSIHVSESGVRDLEALLEKNEQRSQEMGRLAREAYERYFAKEVLVKQLSLNLELFSQHPEWFAGAWAKRHWNCMRRRVGYKAAFYKAVFYHKLDKWLGR